VHAEAERQGTPLRLIVIDDVQLIDGTMGGKRGH
jgi:hypothetical protein